MKKTIATALLLLSVFCSCSRAGGLAPTAKSYLPQLVDREMKEYLKTVDTPDIKDVEVVYDCDSICVLQCRASAKDAAGNVLKETIRYFFIKDKFMSACKGVDCFYHSLTGADFLDENGIEEFCTMMKENSSESFLLYLSRSEPINLFQ
ncbi:MAG: hypothetical protein HUJ91_07005 [Bacteroidales bacterium]|nr:hypothetical protein [Bacteroidales bacterium]